MLPLNNIQSVYAYGYMQQASSDPNKLLGNPVVGFSIDLIEFINNALAKAKQAGDEPDDDSTPSTLLDFATNEIISVKNNKFVRKDGVKELAITQTKDNCYTTQFKGPPQECTRLISDLIFNEDAKAFNDYFALYDDSWFASIARDEIGRINPELAVRILKRFGFNTMEIPQHTGRNLIKFESLSSWMKQLENAQIHPNTLQAIRGATHLKTYLSQLVSFVNGNPVILNSGVVNDKIESEQVDSNSYLGRTKIIMLPRMPLGEPVGDKYTSLQQIARNVTLAHGLMSLPASMPFPFPMMRLPGMMVGGASGGSATLRPIIRGLITDLSRKGKKLRQSDQDAIEGHLVMLEKLEKSLVKVSQQLSEFKDWISIFPDNKTQKISLGTVESSIDKYRQCVSNHANLELGLINVALKLCEQ
jgi:hypothetical protein